jgi:primosomal protein N' (replication factor Y)
MLLHGVTGSGKTEVYLQLIQHVIDSGRHAIVLVPEISLTPQMVDRFRGRFGARVAVMHSRLSPGERYDQWRQIREGEVSIVVGARSAIFAPFSDLGLVVIDEEHENTYKSEITPKYTAAQIAAMRCSNDGALLIYGSATPSTETYQRAIDGEIGLAVMKGRANTMVMPKVHIVDMRKELELGNRSIFSSALSAEIEKNINAGQQTILFLNKRGYASFVLCRSCGIRLKCKHCNITMTYHSVDDRLICHYCGYTVKMPAVCPKCGSSHIRQFGTGTQKVEEELHKYFPEASVIRMDMDTTTGKHSHEEILDAFRRQNINILVGTQMIAKGHDFPNVTLVGVLAADSLLGMDDYRASERTFQLLTQVAGRAGRGQLPGRVVIQTYNTEDYSITTACSHDYDSFFKKEAQIRSRLGYPPFTGIGVAVISSINDKLAYARAKEVCGFLTSRLDKGAGDELLPGPARAPLSRIRNRYRWRVIIKCCSEERLADILSALTDFFARKKDKADVDLSVDINPVSML